MQFLTQFLVLTMIGTVAAMDVYDPYGKVNGLQLCAKKLECKVCCETAEACLKSCIKLKSSLCKEMCEPRAVCSNDEAALCKNECELCKGTGPFETNLPLNATSA